jgi:hypothetical protein
MDALRVRPHTAARLPAHHRPSLLPLAAGLVAAAALLSLYLGIVTVAQDWHHATRQLVTDRWWVGAIVVGFGVQVGLFVYLRRLHSRAAAGGMALSTGTSTAAMLACCAHHLSDVLPVIGVSGAAVFLNQYKTPFLALGVGMNALGITYLLWNVHRARRMHAPGVAVEHRPHEER